MLIAVVLRQNKNLSQIFLRPQNVSNQGCFEYLSSKQHAFLMMMIAIITLYRCVRCLLITESPKTPGHYWYLDLGPRLHPLYMIGGVQFAISRVPVYTAISNFYVCILVASE